MVSIRRIFIAAIVLCCSATKIGYAIENSVPRVTSDLIATSAVRLSYPVNPGKTCSASLIEPRWLVTIAHCVDDFSNRTDPDERDLVSGPNQLNANFFNDTTAFSTPVDRIVRVDGSSTLTNSVALLHLSASAPDWAQPLPLYDGDFPDPDEHIKIYGFGGGQRKGGIVNIIRRDWIDYGQFWALRLARDPSYPQGGDSGGPLLVERAGRNYLIGVHWNSGGAPGGSAAAVIDIDNEGHWNPIASLIGRIINPSPAGGLAPDPLTYYQIRPVHSRKCLHVKSASVANRAPIWQWNCLREDHFYFRFEPESWGGYRIRAKHSSDCWHIKSASHENRAPVWQWSCENMDHFKFALLPESDITDDNLVYKIRAYHSGACLHVKSADSDNRAPLWQWFACDDPRDHFKFGLYPVELVR